MTRIRQWSIGTVVAVLAVLAAGWFLLVSPQHSKAAALRSSTATTEQASATLRTQIAVLQAQARRLPAERAQLAAVSRQLPTAAQLPTLIRQLTAAAKGSSADLVSISPGALAPVAAAGTTVVGAAPAGGVSFLPVTLTAKGGFFALEEMLGNLERLPRAFVVSTVTVAPADSSGSAAGSAASTGATSGAALTLSVTGRVFVATPPTAPGPASSTPTTTAPASGSTTRTN